MRGEKRAGATRTSRKTVDYRAFTSPRRLIIDVIIRRFEYFHPERHYDV